MARCIKVLLGKEYVKATIHYTTDEMEIIDPMLAYVITRTWICKDKFVANGVVLLIYIPQELRID